METRALVLAAHGSRHDPFVNALVRGQAERVRALGLFDEVAVAFHQGSPSFRDVLDELESTSVTVVPLMTSAGYFARMVLPRELERSRRRREVRLRVTEPVGTHPGVVPLVADRVRHLLSVSGLPAGDTSVVVVGHGTRRHPRSRRSTESLARALGDQGLPDVVAGFLDEPPGVEEALERARLRHVVVVPFLIGAGPHASMDIPRRLGLAGTELPLSGVVGGRLVVCDTAIGGDPGILDLILLRALGDEALPAPRRAVSPGTVWIVGAGPGDPGLITVRGLELLRKADVVVHDRLVAPELIREARPGAEIVDVGKRPGSCRHVQEAIHGILVDRARQGLEVVRLKGGDPFVFGRGFEEVEACRDAGLSCVVVPGVTSAIAVPAAAGIPVTLRDVGRSFAVVTAHTRTGEELSADLFRSLAGIDTVVVLMGHARLASVLEGLMEGGMAPDTPAACVESGTTPRQRVVVGTASTLAAEARRQGLRAPVTTIVGAVVARARGARELASLAASTAGR